MKADPKESLGARLERKAMRAYLRRQLSIEGTNTATGRALHAALDWLLARSARYDRKAGGLGK